MTRLVAVLGYSDGGERTLHGVCAARLARATSEARADDIVLFTGWARGRSAAAEADLMAESWSTPCARVLLDRGARTTLGNALAVARAARRSDAREVVLVTSRWHARRASVLARAALLGSGTSLRVAATDEVVTPRLSAREAAAWAAVPLLAVVAVCNR